LNATPQTHRESGAFLRSRITLKTSQVTYIN
jgi:hypothetical protein